MARPQTARALRKPLLRAETFAFPTVLANKAVDPRKLRSAPPNQKLINVRGDTGGGGWR